MTPDKKHSEIKKAIGEIAPEKAVDLSDKYSKVIMEIEDSLTGEKKGSERREIAKSGKEQLDAITKDILIAAKPMSAEGVVSERSDLLSILDGELDLVGAALNEVEAIPAKHVEQFEEYSYELDGSAADLSRFMADTLAQDNDDVIKYSGEINELYNAWSNEYYRILNFSTDRFGPDLKGAPSDVKKRLLGLKDIFSDLTAAYGEFDNGMFSRYEAERKFVPFMSLKDAESKGLVTIRPNGDVVFAKKGLVWADKENPDNFAALTSTELSKYSADKLAVANDVFAKSLPPNLKVADFFLDYDRSIKRPGLEGTFEIGEDGSVIYRDDYYGALYLRPGADVDITSLNWFQWNNFTDATEWDAYEDYNLEASLPDNVKGKGFYFNHKGELKRKTSDKGVLEGVYTVNADKSLFYRDSKGVKTLKPGQRIDTKWIKVVGVSIPDFDKTSEWSVSADVALEGKLPSNLRGKDFFIDHKGALRKTGHEGTYLIASSGEVKHINKQEIKILPAGGDVDKDWEVVAEKMAFHTYAFERRQIDRKIKRGIPIDVEAVKEIVSAYSSEQQADMMRLALESIKMTKMQEIRIAQVGMLKMIVESLRSDLKDERTSKEDWRQDFEFEGTTTARAIRLSDHLNAIKEAAYMVEYDPTKTLNDAIPIATRRLIAREANYSTGGKYTHRRLTHLAGLMDTNGKIKEPSTKAGLRRQNLAVLKFLRDNKDYARAQELIEDELLVNEFAKRREEKYGEAIQERYFTSAVSKVREMITPEIKEQWKKQGLASNAEEVELAIKMIARGTAVKDMNAEIAKENNGLPFRLGGVNSEFQLIYKDMMGTGEWYNLSDSDWDAITKELLIAIPLTIATMGVGTVLAGIVTAGKFAMALKTLSTMGRFGTGWLAARTISLATVSVPSAATYLTARHGIDGEFFFAMEGWQKELLWTSATFAGGMLAMKAAAPIVNKISTMLGGFSGEYATLLQAASKMIVNGSATSGAMLAISALRHATEHGYVMKDYKFGKELITTLILVGALSISHGMVASGTTRFRGSASARSLSGKFASLKSGAAQRYGAYQAKRAPRVAARRAARAEKYAAKHAESGPSMLSNLRSRFSGLIVKGALGLSLLTAAPAIASPGMSAKAPIVSTQAVSKMPAATSGSGIVISSGTPALRAAAKSATVKASPVKSIESARQWTGKAAQELVKMPQSKITASYKAQGIKAEVVSGINATHASVPEGLRPYVRIILDADNVQHTVYNIEQLKADYDIDSIKSMDDVINFMTEMGMFSESVVDMYGSPLMLESAIAAYDRGDFEPMQAGFGGPIGLVFMILLATANPKSALGLWVLSDKGRRKMIGGFGKKGFEMAGGAYNYLRGKKKPKVDAEATEDPKFDKHSDIDGSSEPKAKDSAAKVAEPAKERSATMKKWDAFKESRWGKAAHIASGLYIAERVWSFHYGDPLGRGADEEKPENGDNPSKVEKDDLGIVLPETKTTAPEVPTAVGDIQYDTPVEAEEAPGVKLRTFANNEVVVFNNEFGIPSNDWVVKSSETVKGKTVYSLTRSITILGNRKRVFNRIASQSELSELNPPE